jgi:D-alanine-D-alanine ligase
MRVAVLAGGPGGERDISLQSAAAVIGALDTLGWPSWRVVIGGLDTPSTWPSGSGTALEALRAIEAWAPDAVFIAMHGQWGEDGRIQAALDLAGLPYQGSGVFASALAMDKIRAKETYRTHGVPVAPDRIVPPSAVHQTVIGATIDALVSELGLPLVMKTPGSGSSVGVAIADTREQAAQILGTFAAQQTPTLAEAFVAGREFTCPVLEREDGQPEALPVVEIRPKRARFFDFHAKYAPDETDELCPAPIDAELETALRSTGLAAHAALGCRGYSRTDVRVDDAGRIFVLETNTLPGLTPASLLPKAAAAHGLDFPSLIARLLRRAAYSR